MKKLNLISAAFFFSALAAFSGQKPESLSVCDFQQNPLGMNLEPLTFSWKLPESPRPIYQSAYRIVVATNAQALEKFPDVWDSGKVKSNQNLHIPYGGRKVLSTEKLLWKVMFWDDADNASEWSQTNSLEAGLTDMSEWKNADWIKTSVGKIFINDRMMPCIFRKEFSVEKKIAKARLYIASRGIFEAHLNGKKIGDEFWGTGWTDYKKRVQSNTYDVTNMLNDGANALGLTLADGWFSGSMTWGNKECFYGKRPEIIAVLIITFADGSVKKINTDNTWKNAKSAILAADIYDGEAYDARLEENILGWDKTGFDDSKWLNADVANRQIAEAKGESLIEPRRNTPIRTIQTLKPISVKNPKSGVYIFDFGQNLVGSINMALKAPRNTVLKIRYAEMLNDDGSLYTENYRTADSTDYYIFKGESLEKWTPSFTYHGFRYVEFSGLPDESDVDENSLTALVWHNDMKQIGKFSTSNNLINKLQSNIIWGQKGNFFSTPTDCPQRDERLGWTGDAQVFAPTAAFNFDVSAFFRKWTLDLRDAQRPNGSFPSLAPAVAGGDGGPAWADAGVIVPWVNYLAYGDKNFLSENYEAMKLFIAYMKKDSTDYIRRDLGYGDWLQPYAENPRNTDTPRDLIATAYFAYSAKLTSKIALILDKKEDAKYFEDLSKNVAEAFTKKFVDENCIVGKDSQTAYLLALAFDLLPEEKRQQALDNLIKAIEKAGGHLRTGFVGTPLLANVLTRFGKSQEAYKLLLKESYPSWIFSINQGATTMWERWNSYSKKDGFGSAGMNSFNHYAYGAIGQWMYEKIGGFETSQAAPAYKETIFAPELGGGFTSASAQLESPYGLIKSEWKIQDKIFVWNITIAPNTSGKIVFPTDSVKNISAGNMSIQEWASKHNLLIDVCKSSGRIVLKNVPNSKYEFKVKLN